MIPLGPAGVKRDPALPTNGQAPLPFSILPLGSAGPFRQTSPQVGWPGDPATGQIAPARTFAGDRSAASRFLTQPLAVQWAAFIGM
jgi:hypothetical protein